MGAIGVLVPWRWGRGTLLGVTLVVVVLAAPVYAASTGAVDARARAAAGADGNNSTNVSSDAPGPNVAVSLADATRDVVFETDTAYLWVSTPQTTDVTVRAPAGSPYDDYRVCLSVESGSDDRRRVGCERVDAAGGANASSTVTWTPEATGPRTLVATLVGASGSDSQVVSRDATSVHVMERTGDVDNDKLANAKELDAGTNLTDTDSDDDGLLDGAEVTEYGTDPLVADTDGDGVRDAVEIQQGTDPTVRDTDHDGLADGAEIDGDTDPTVADTDGDGVEDGRERAIGTDPTVADTDGDGLSDGFELRHGTDPTVADTDGDGLGDGLERQLGTDPAAAWSPVVVAAVGVGALLAVAAVLVRRRRRGDGAARARADAADESAGDDDGPITDRDRILQLLEDAGGQLKQTRIVEETDWSKAKVSRVLSGMEEDGEISKIRIGRENLICSKGNEPDLARPSI